MMNTPSTTTSTTPSSAQQQQQNNNNLPLALLPLTVHSSFRDEEGQQVKPYGLQWQVDGESYLTYAPISNDAAKMVQEQMKKIMVVQEQQQEEEEEQDPSNNTSNNNNNNNITIKNWIVAAHNRWAFARDWPMRQVQDIRNIIEWHPKQQSHDNQLLLKVEWDPDISRHYDEKRYTIAETSGLLKMDPSVVSKGEDDQSNSPTEVWINGYYQGLLSSETLSTMIDKVKATPSRKLLYRKSPSKDTCLSTEDHFFRPCEYCTEKSGDIYCYNADEARWAKFFGASCEIPSSSSSSNNNNNKKLVVKAD